MTTRIDTTVLVILQGDIADQDVVNACLVQKVACFASIEQELLLQTHRMKEVRIVFFDEKSRFIVEQEVKRRSPAPY